MTECTSMAKSSSMIRGGCLEKDSFADLFFLNYLGVPAFAVHQFGFLGGMFLGLVLAHNASIAAGIGVGFGLFFGMTALSVFIAQSPDSKAPGFWGGNVYLQRLWWLAFYSVSQRKNQNPHSCLLH